MLDCAELLKLIGREIPGIQRKENVLLAPYTTFRIGGPCRLMLIPVSVSELGASLALLNRAGIRPFILGAGSNLLFPDEGYDGVVILLKGCISEISCPEPDVILAEAGVTLAHLGRFALEKALTGLEFAHGIPGTVGGGIFMNAGAYGGELKNVVRYVEYFDYEGVLHRIGAEECRFSYRDSLFQHCDSVIVRAAFELQRGEPEEIRALMADLSARRRDKQPLEYPSAGSVFRRPAGYFAGALIEQAGLKGLRIGDAAVSEKHAGFIVNLGGATAKDVCRLIETVQDRVFDMSGVRLEPEIRLIH